MSETIADDGWEARMAARARERAASKAREEVGQREAIRVQQPWMNGWPRIGGNQMLIGAGVHCVCCGRPRGITCVAFPEDWEPPVPEPYWPFGEDDCPLCAIQNAWRATRDR